MEPGTCNLKHLFPAAQRETGNWQTGYRQTGNLKLATGKSNL
jgi:hypothetical protein